MKKSSRSRSGGDRTHHGQRTASFRVPSGSRLIMGRNCVRETLLHAPHKLETLLVAKTQADARGESIVAAAMQADVSVIYFSVDELSQIVGSDSHQSFVGVCRPHAPLDLKDFILSKDADAPSVVLLVDNVHDPQNLGAMLRAAECFGVDAVVWSKNRGASLTPAASKASVGASELLSTIVVSNLVDAARKLKDAGYWLVGADVGEGASSIYDFEFPGRAALILGSEEAGMQDLLKRLLDYRVYIPMRGKIDSLNVSQATAVFLGFANKR